MHITPYLIPGRTTILSMPQQTITVDVPIDEPRNVPMYHSSDSRPSLYVSFTNERVHHMHVRVRMFTELASAKHTYVQQLCQWIIQEMNLPYRAQLIRSRAVFVGVGEGIHGPEGIEGSLALHIPSSLRSLLSYVSLVGLPSGYTAPSPHTSPLRRLASLVGKVLVHISQRSLLT